MASIKKGSEGPEVTLLQGVLRAMGYEVDIDGNFGPGTESAVKQAQADLGVDSDGKVGNQTAAALVGKVGIEKANMSLQITTLKAQLGQS